MPFPFDFLFELQRAPNFSLFQITLHPYRQPACSHSGLTGDHIFIVGKVFPESIKGAIFRFVFHDTRNALQGFNIALY